MSNTIQVIDDSTAIRVERRGSMLMSHAFTEYL